MSVVPPTAQQEILARSQQKKPYTKAQTKAVKKFLSYLDVTIGLTSDTVAYYTEQKRKLANAHTFSKLGRYIETVPDVNDFRKEYELLYTLDEKSRELSVKMFQSTIERYYDNKINGYIKNLQSKRYLRDCFINEEPLSLIFQSQLASYGLFYGSRWKNIVHDSSPMFSFDGYELIYQNREQKIKMHNFENETDLFKMFFETFYTFVSGDTEVKSQLQYTPVLKAHLDQKITSHCGDIFCLDALIKNHHDFLLPKDTTRLPTDEQVPSYIFMARYKMPIMFFEDAKPIADASFCTIKEEFVEQYGGAVKRFIGDVAEEHIKKVQRDLDNVFKKKRKKRKKRVPAIIESASKQTTSVSSASFDAHVMERSVESNAPKNETPLAVDPLAPPSLERAPVATSDGPDDVRDDEHTVNQNAKTAFFAQDDTLQGEIAKKSEIENSTKTKTSNAQHLEDAMQTLGVSDAGQALKETETSLQTPKVSKKDKRRLAKEKKAQEAIEKAKSSTRKHGQNVSSQDEEESYRAHHPHLEEDVRFGLKSDALRIMGSILDDTLSPTTRYQDIVTALSSMDIKIEQRGNGDYRKLILPNGAKIFIFKPAVPQIGHNFKKILRTGLQEKWGLTAAHLGN